MDLKLNFVSLEVEGGICSSGRGADAKPAIFRGERSVGVTPCKGFSQVDPACGMAPKPTI